MGCVCWVVPTAGRSGGWGGLACAAHWAVDSPALLESVAPWMVGRLGRLGVCRPFSGRLTSSAEVVSSVEWPDGWAARRMSAMGRPPCRLCWLCCPLGGRLTVWVGAVSAVGWSAGQAFVGSRRPMGGSPGGGLACVGHWMVGWLALSGCVGRWMVRWLGWPGVLAIGWPPDRLCMDVLFVGWGRLSERVGACRPFGGRFIGVVGACRPLSGRLAMWAAMCRHVSAVGCRLKGLRWGVLAVRWPTGGLSLGVSSVEWSTGGRWAGPCRPFDGRLIGSA